MRWSLGTPSGFKCGSATFSDWRWMPSRALTHRAALAPLLLFHLEPGSYRAQQPLPFEDLPVLMQICDLQLALTLAIQGD